MALTEAQRHGGRALTADVDSLHGRELEPERPGTLWLRASVRNTMALTEAQRHGGRLLIADDDACTDGSFIPDDHELCGSVPL